MKLEFKVEAHPPCEPADFSGAPPDPAFSEVTTGSGINPRDAGLEALELFFRTAPLRLRVEEVNEVTKAIEGLSVLSTMSMGERHFVSIYWTTKLSYDDPIVD